MLFGFWTTLAEVHGRPYLFAPQRPKYTAVPDRRNYSWSVGDVLIPSVIRHSSQAFCIATSAQYEKKGQHHFLERIIMLYVATFWSMRSTPLIQPLCWYMRWACTIVTLFFSTYDQRCAWFDAVAIRSSIYSHNTVFIPSYNDDTGILIQLIISCTSRLFPQFLWCPCR